MSEYEFEPSWDDHAQVWRVTIYGYTEEPTELPGIARAPVTLWHIVVAVVKAAPSAMSDHGGLFWKTKSDVNKAVRAARKAAK